MTPPDDPTRLSPLRSSRIDATAWVLDLAPIEGAISWPAVFGNDQPVELEVGSGKGLFLVNAATARPEHNFLGIELSRKYARRAAERLAKRGISNAKVLAGDARSFLAQRVAPASLRAVHVYFPDPWWKARHKKRRVFGEPLLTAVERELEPGGDLWVATDVKDYFDVIEALVATRPRFERRALPEPQSPTHDLDYLTNFERKYRLEGRQIHRAHYRLIDETG